ncbi:MAG: J domain-containing protein, partial [Trebonia sp.]
MAPGFDPYAVLGVSRDATAAAITQARRRLSRQYHPDVNGAPDAAARFDAVQRAFTLLSDPAARAEYDRAGIQPGKPRQPGAATEPARGMVAEPAAVNFGHLGPGRPVADATVIVTWTGARPGRIIGDQGSGWWMIVGTAVSSTSNAVLFHLRAHASAGLPDGPRHAQFTASLDGTQVVVPLTAEFSHAAWSPASDAARPTPPRRLWPRLVVLGLFVAVIVVKVIFLGIASPAGGNSAGSSAPAVGSPPAQSEQAASPPASVSVPQSREAAIAVRPVFIASQAASDKAKESSAGMAGPPVQHGFEVLLPVASPPGAGSATPDFCVTVIVPSSNGATGSSVTESALGTVTAGGGTDLAFPAVLPGRYTLDPHCSARGAAP